MTAHSHTGTSSLVVDGEPDAVTLPRLLRSRQLRLFYGDLHNHTGYSDGTGRPEDALRQMRDRGLHFAAITDHGEFFDRRRAQAKRYWEAAAQVAALTGEEFVAIRGFEWSSPNQGHSNVWWSAEHTGYHQTGDESMAQYYEWLVDPRPSPGNQVLAGFNHPGREVTCFDGCMYLPALDDRIVTLECFNRDDDYGATFFRALDNGWHVGAIGVSDHHGDDWGSPRLPRAGLLAPTLTVSSIQSALLQRQVFATRSPTLALLVLGNDALMGARLVLPAREPLTIGVWCDDPAAEGRVARLELWTNGGTLVGAHETNGLQQVSLRFTVPPQSANEQWFVVRVLHSGTSIGYSSPIWAAWC